YSQPKPYVETATVLPPGGLLASHVRAQKLKPRTGVEPLHLAAKKKRGCLQKPAGGFKPPTTHQGRRGLFQTTLTYLGSLKWPEAGSRPGASFNAGLGELAAPSGIRAPSPNAIIGLGASNAILNQICWVLQQICYQADLLQNATSRSDKFQISAAAPAAQFLTVPSTPNHLSCTEVLARNLAATGAAI
ncbi:hypothetical protein DSO57_1018161, partial [Entomophthora muscae]